MDDSTLLEVSENTLDDEFRRPLDDAYFTHDDTDFNEGDTSHSPTRIRSSEKENTVGSGDLTRPSTSLSNSLDQRKNKSAKNEAMSRKEDLQMVILEKIRSRTILVFVKHIKN